MGNKKIVPFDPKTILAIAGGSDRKPAKYRKKQVLFSQGGPADAVFFIEHGKVKLTVVSGNGKEAVLAVLGDGDFVGEACLVAGQLVRMATATCLEDSSIVRIEKSAMIRALKAEPTFSEVFMTHLLSRNMRSEEDLVDQLFNSSEKRLARILLLMAHFGKESPQNLDIPKISQETLAQMVGTTRSRISFFMNKFRKLGLIDYNSGGTTVNDSLLNVVLRD